MHCSHVPISHGVSYSDHRVPSQMVRFAVLIVRDDYWVIEVVNAVGLHDIMTRTAARTLRDQHLLRPGRLGKIVLDDREIEN